MSQRCALCTATIVGDESDAREFDANLLNGLSASWLDCGGPLTDTSRNAMIKRIVSSPVAGLSQRDLGRDGCDEGEKSSNQHLSSRASHGDHWTDTRRGAKIDRFFGQRQTSKADLSDDVRDRPACGPSVEISNRHPDPAGRRPHPVRRRGAARCTRCV